MFTLPLLLSKMGSLLFEKYNNESKKKYIAPEILFQNEKLVDYELDSYNLTKKINSLEYIAHSEHFEDIKLTIEMLLSKMDYCDNMYKSYSNSLYTNIKKYESVDGHFPIEIFYIEGLYYVNGLYCESENIDLQFNGYYFNVHSINEINEIVDKLRYLHYLLDHIDYEVCMMVNDYYEKDNILYPNLNNITVEKICDMEYNIKYYYDLYVPSYITRVNYKEKLIMHPLNFDGNIYFYFVDGVSNRNYLWAVDYADTILEKEYIGLCEEMITIIVPDNLKICDLCGYGDCYYHDQ